MTPPLFTWSVWPAYPEFPHTYELTCTDPGSGDNNPLGIFNTIAALMQRDLAQLLYIFRINPDLVRGHIAGETEGGQNKTYENLISIAGITYDVIQDITEGIQESNQDISITDIEWKFYYDINTMVQGAARVVRKPNWWPNKFIHTWISVPENVSCAAFALCYLMYNNTHEYRRLDGRSKRDSEELMEELGWDLLVSFIDLQKFIDKYPKYKLVLLVSDMLKMPSTLIITGTEYSNTENILYLFYDQYQNHYASHPNMNALVKKKYKSKVLSWCYTCHCCYSHNQRHVCVDNTTFLKKENLSKCHKCGYIGSHICDFWSCRACGLILKKDVTHRCILWKHERKEELNSFQNDGDGSKPALWAYDFESRIIYGEESLQKVIVKFIRNPNGKYATCQLRARRKIYSEKHEVVLVVCKNVFSGEEIIFEGETPMDNFLNFLNTYNNGNNICIAHNGSGYDAKLILFYCYKRYTPADIKVIMRGSNILLLVIGEPHSKQKVKFIDSMRHLPGSLKSLAKEYCNGLLEKGYFPHTFTQPENFHYIGPIPDKSYFDIAFGAKSQEDVDAFNTWYSAYSLQMGDKWDFNYEFKKYCVNDVQVLSVIIQKYHDIGMEEFGSSPWFNSTSPSYVHECSIRNISINLEDGYNLSYLKKEYPQTYKDTLDNLAKTKTWAVQKAYEYWFCRAALRGGRTCITQMYRKLTEEEIKAGWVIDYDDVVSMYPHMQISKEFPCGLPTVHIYNPDYRPCLYKECYNNPKLKCQHPDKRHDKNIDYKIHKHQPLTDEIMTWFGFVCLDIQPCKMIHPILPTFDAEKKKCLFSCELITEQVFTTAELQCALKNGYKVIKVHSYHSYHKNNLFADISKKLYIQKMINSRTEPDLEELAQQYDKKHDKDFGDMVRNTQGKWGKNPAKKASFKVWNNSGWGKHAQCPILPTIDIYNLKTQADEISAFYANCSAKNFAFQQAINLDEEKVMYRYEKSGIITDFSGFYLPAAVFVPSYARIMLVEKLISDGEEGASVLMCDTDSYIAIRKPGITRETGIVLGDWEKEGVDSDHGGIKTFVGLGPKTYSVQCMDGFKSQPKTKGVRLGWATDEIVNFDVFENLIKNYLSGTGATEVDVPQTNFKADMKKGAIYTIRTIKKMGINVEESKGDIDENGFIWPFGYKTAPDKCPL